MIERVIENWLDNSTERSFEKPFCFMLSSKGHTIVHLTRHCAMELGKDIIAIAPDGVPCAYQLKSAHNGRISLTQWRDEISPQILELVQGQIVHPSVKKKLHRSYLVTNGELDEEVSRAIDDMNANWVRLGSPNHQLRTIVKGELLRMARELEANLWPTELEEIKTLLEFYLEPGNGMIKKHKLANLFESTLPLHWKGKGKSPAKQIIKRAISSCALLNAIALTNFSNKRNYLAEIEAWIMYIAYIFALATKYDLKEKLWQNELSIAIDAVKESLKELCAELRVRSHLIEGEPIDDLYVYRARVTWLLALMSIYGLWIRDAGAKTEDEERDAEFIRDFCQRNQRRLQLWGEAAIPQFLCSFWYLKKIDPSPRPDFLIASLISAISNSNRPNRKRKDGNPASLANPYYGIEEILPYLAGISKEPIDEEFEGRSYTLEGLVHLFVRRNWKVNMRLLWPAVTYLVFNAFEPAHDWHFFRWMNSEGTHKDMIPKPRQDWEELKLFAFEAEGKSIPPLLKAYPMILLLFICVYPHRLNSDIMRWLDSWVRNI